MRLTSAPGGTRNARSASLRSLAWWTPGARPRAGQTLWGYCHVPAGSDVDMSDRIEGQIERFAPGFRDRILARSVRTASDMERYNPGYVGGDITAGAATLRQTIGRPALRWNAVPDAAAGRLPVFRVDPAGRRRARHVRPVGRQDRAKGPAPGQFRDGKRLTSATAAYRHGHEEAN